MLNKKKFILLSIASLMLCSVSAFASNLTNRNVYGILSENFTGAAWKCGQSEDNITAWVGGANGEWAGTGYSHISSDTANAKEGKKYLEYVVEKSVGAGGSGSWACFAFYSVESDNATVQYKNISHFKYLDFWVKWKKGDITKLLVGITDTVGGDKCVSLASLGVTNAESVDKAIWQHCEIDITKLGANLNSVKNLFLVKTEGSVIETETAVLFDNIVLRTDSSSASFNVNLKSIEDMENPDPSPTQITWDNDSVFHNGWQAARQYIELDMDMYSYAWKVRMWVNNGAKSRNGLYATLGGKDYVIPMCWRVYNGTLVNLVGAKKDTYLMAQSSKSHHNIYDRGMSPDVDPDYYPWLYFKEYKDIDFSNEKDLDYITVWDSSIGYHGFSAADIKEGFYEFDPSNREKKPKIYFGGDFNQAAGGLNYLANIVIELSYE